MHLESGKHGAHSGNGDPGHVPQISLQNCPDVDIVPFNWQQSAKQRWMRGSRQYSGAFEHWTAAGDAKLQRESGKQESHRPAGSCLHGLHIPDATSFPALQHAGE